MSSNMRSTKVSTTRRSAGSPPSSSYRLAPGIAGKPTSAERERRGARNEPLLGPVALLVLLAAAAGAGVVSADAGLRAFDRRALHLDPVDEHPARPLLAKQRSLAMLHLHVLDLVAGDELDRSDFV